MDLYSFTLSLGLTATATAVFAAWLGTQLPHDHAARPTAARAGGVAGVVAVVMLLGAGVVHVAFGHRPGTPDALAPLAFCREHPALLVGFGAAVLAVVTLRLPRSPGGV